MFTFKSELKFQTPTCQSQVPQQTTTTKSIDSGPQVEEDELAKDEPERKKRRIEKEQIREIKPGGEGGGEGNESVQPGEERKDTDDGSSIETTIKSSGSPSRRTTM
ncbi:hypothetical protein JCM5350_006404 [Sporobolomyces pararoseus]